jgi:hypothetical protein
MDLPLCIVLLQVNLLNVLMFSSRVELMLMSYQMSLVLIGVFDLL